MYKLRRLRALLRSLTATPPTRLQIIRSWLVVMLGYAALALFVLSLVLHLPLGRPITWRDVLTFDPLARAYLLAAFAALVSGGSFLYWGSSFGWSGLMRMLPPRGFGPALRRAIRNHESRVAPTEPVAPVTLQMDTLTPTRLTVAAPQLLTRPLWLAIVTLASGALALAPLTFFIWFASEVVGSPADPTDAAQMVAGSLQLLRFAGIFAPLGVIAMVFAWRFWILWRTGVRGAEVTVNSEGLAIRDYTTLWRGRVIRWDEVVSLARFTYNDDYVRSHTVYLLDAGNQTLLWEAPPDMRYVTPARHARIAERQVSAARLLALIVSETGQSLVNITSIVSEVAKIEPNPYATGDEPDPKDAKLLEFVEGALSEKDLLTLTPPLTTEAKWRRLLMAGLVMAALWASAFFFAG